jgi:hypothetical protein
MGRSTPYWGHRSPWTNGEPGRARERTGNRCVGLIRFILGRPAALIYWQLELRQSWSRGLTCGRGDSAKHGERELRDTPSEAAEHARGFVIRRSGKGGRLKGRHEEKRKTRDVDRRTHNMVPGYTMGLHRTARDTTLRVVRV